MSHLVIRGAPVSSSQAGHISRFPRGLVSWASGLAVTIRRWNARSSQRRALAWLADLDDYLLKDIGVTREQARREAAKPFWR